MSLFKHFVNEFVVLIDCSACNTNILKLIVFKSFLKKS